MIAFENSYSAAAATLREMRLSLQRDRDLLSSSREAVRESRLLLLQVDECFPDVAIAPFQDGGQARRVSRA